MKKLMFGLKDVAVQRMSAARRSRDLTLLFSARMIRMLSYGLLSVVLALYLIQIGLGEAQVGLLFTFTLVGDAGISLWLTTSADRWGRKRTLCAGALLMLVAGLAFLVTQDLVLLMLAAAIGVISPSGNEIGPFLPVEQSSLAQLTPDDRRTQTFAWYNLAGSFATAAGALAGGWAAQGLQVAGVAPLESYRYVIAGYAVGGGLLLLLFLNLSPRIEISHEPGPAASRYVLGLHRSRATVARLGALFALDAFAGGLILQSMIAYWFFVRFGVNEGTLGTIFFAANILAGVSALTAARIAARFGLLNTMVFTHLPSNVLLMLIAWMPSFPLALTLLLVRFSISQMDVPTRQSYTMAVVAPDERSAASGVTAIARSIGASLSPALAGLFLAVPAFFNLPFLLAGGLKIVYDLSLYHGFRALRPPEESGPARLIQPGK